MSIDVGEQEDTVSEENQSDHEKSEEEEARFRKLEIELDLLANDPNLFEDLKQMKR